ncbi:hypothetical protein [Tepidicella xavieri]|uniref:DUF2946 family protein n=1 Tax=Tepidicella xavieri TaxID=360241 RepID=A0A4R6U319_9BURK|nr:hypothetical protein [Tepidicella xavieri]TDQ38795.1 hypothetical protein DFR43_1201 [Tepidicella xavieri]
MRRWVLCLLLVLLPWRLWAADAMALQMASLPPGSTEQVACHGEPSAEPAHAHGQMADAHAHSDSSASGPDHHGLCLLCDVCHNAYWLAPPHPAQGSGPIHHAPPSLDVSLASVEPEPGFKPPIF